MFNYNNISIPQTNSDEHKEQMKIQIKNWRREQKDCRERAVTEKKPHVRQSNPETYEVMLAYQKS